MSSSPQSSPRSRRIVGKLLLLLVLAALGVGGWYTYRHFAAASQAEKSTGIPVHVVAFGDMVVSITEGGSLSALKEEVIRNEVPGQSRITFLVPEGKVVKKGELLVELDSSELLAKVNSQQIEVQKAVSSAQNADENLSIKKSQNESNIREAELKVHFAKMDLEKYRDGDYPQQLRKAEADITIAEAELTRARDTLTWTEKLQEQGYATRSELEADKLDVNRKQLNLQNAKHQLEVLKKYDNPQQIAKLEAEVTKLGEELERVKRRAAAEYAQAESDLESKKAQLDLNKEKLVNLQTDYNRTRILAPQSGMVVYSTGSGGRSSNNQEFLDVGVLVNFRQEMLKLPDLSQMTVEVKIHEARVGQISVGLPVAVTFDTLPERVFQGRISKVAMLPDAQSSWMNPDLKVFTTTILIEDSLPESVKPGVSTKVQILVANLQEVIAVPLQTVVTHKGQQYVFLVDAAGELHATPVRLGLFNESMVHVEAGLDEGQRVSLSPPKTQDAIGRFVNLVAKEDVARIQRAKPTEAYVAAVAAQAAENEETVEIPTDLLERLPADRRERLEERWSTMTNDERRSMIERMRNWQGGGGRDSSVGDEAGTPGGS